MDKDTATLRMVVEAVSAVTNVNKYDIIGKSRTANVVNARRIAICLLYNNGLKAMDIAHTFFTERSNVYSCIARQKELNQTYPAERKTFQACENQILDAINKERSKQNV